MMLRASLEGKLGGKRGKVENFAVTDVLLLLVSKIYWPMVFRMKLYMYRND